MPKSPRGAQTAPARTKAAAIENEGRMYTFTEVIIPSGTHAEPRISLAKTQTYVVSAFRRTVIVRLKPDTTNEKTVRLEPDTTYERLAYGTLSRPSVSSM